MAVSKYLALLIAVVIVVALALLLIYPRLTAPPTKVLKVGTSPDFPPFEFIDEKGNIVGIDIDLVKAIAKRLGYEVEVISIDFEGLIPALLNKQIDVIASGMTITEERAEVVAFTTPYWEADQAILVVVGSGFKPQSLDDLVNKKVGVQSGTTAEQLVHDYITNTGKSIDVRSYSSYVLAVVDLVNGRLDAVIVDSPVAQMFTREYNVEVSVVIQTGEKYGLAVRKDDVELLSKLNEALGEFLSSDEWMQIIDKYLGG